MHIGGVNLVEIRIPKKFAVSFYILRTYSQRDYGGVTVCRNLFSQYRMKQTQALIPRALHTYRQVKHKGRLIVKSPVSDVCAILIYYCPRKMKDGFTHHKHKNGQPHAPVHGKCKSLYLLAVFFF